MDDILNFWNFILYYRITPDVRMRHEPSFRELDRNFPHPQEEANYIWCGGACCGVYLDCKVHDGE